MDWDKLFPARVRLRPSGTVHVIHVESTELHQHYVRVSGELKHAYKLTAKNGLDLSEIPWAITIYRGPADPMNESAIGVVTYSGNVSDGEVSFDAELTADIAVSPISFEQIVASSNAGAPKLSELTMTLRGIAYGDDPDGSDKIWDLETRPIITEVTLCFSKDEQPDAGISGHHAAPAAIAPSQRDALLADVLAAARQISAKANWMIALLAAAAVALLLK